MYELKNTVGGLHYNDFANYYTLTYKVTSILQPSNCLCASDFMTFCHSQNICAHTCSVQVCGRESRHQLVHDHDGTRYIQQLCRLRVY